MLLRQYSHTTVKGIPPPYEAKKDTTSIVDNVYNAFVATKNERFEPITSELKQRIVDIITPYIENNRPIPILIAASCCKIPNFSEPLDVAELSFLGMMIDLQKRCISGGYQPGFDIRVRLEDLTVMHLFAVPEDSKDSTDSIGIACQNYHTKFQELVTFLNMDSFLQLIPESKLMTDREEFESRFTEAHSLFSQYLLNGTTSETSVTSVDLEQLNWFGGVSEQMQSFLLQSYSRLYPSLSKEQQYDLMARYFACICTRRSFPLGYGNDPTHWDTHGRLEISLCSPLPDTALYSAPFAPVHSRFARIFYRSSPLLLTKEQMAFWAARGHINTVRNIDQIRLVSNRSLSHSVSHIEQIMILNPLNPSKSNDKELIVSAWVS
jgi:hypothetical protein